MKTWIIEPRDPLIVRDGRPFGADIAGARARSLDFPFPSTTTGGVRTRYGQAKGGDFDAALITEVKSKSVKGPLLVELDAEGNIESWMFTAPADALWFEYDPADEQQAVLKSLVPLSLKNGEKTSLESDLSPVGLTTPDPRKPFGRPPRYWRWEKFEQWLKDPEKLTDPGEHTVVEFGHNGPLMEERTHVSITPETQAAADGALYQTRGLEFIRSAGCERRRLALAVMTDADLPKAGLAPLGGERRLVTWRENTNGAPDCPADLRRAIQDSEACRAILLTPAHFNRGFRPEWLEQSHINVTATLMAAAIHRPKVVSGWDFDRTKSKYGRPKPTRRLAPAGSVYFFKLTGEPKAIGNWVDAMWMNCVSDDRNDGEAPDQDRKDGFGLIALGAWSGVCKSMEGNR